MMANEVRSSNKIGIGMDSAVIPLDRHPGLSLVQSVDFFYPLIDDPVAMGRIAFANMASDIYATGVQHLDKVTLILSAPTEFTDKERDVIIPMMISGFQDAAASVGCIVRVGNIAVNPWCMVGGVVTSVCTEDEIIMPTGAQSGDVLVLTKPLGTQLATNAYHWMKDSSDKWTKLKANAVEEDDIFYTYNRAVTMMALLNATGAKLMHKYGAHCGTDVTGFGLRGHAQNLLNFQSRDVSFCIKSLPIIKNVRTFAQALNMTEKLYDGRAVETSGGLLICLPSLQAAQSFCVEHKAATGVSGWIIGECVEGNREVLLDAASVEFIDVE